VIWSFPSGGAVAFGAVAFWAFAFGHIGADRLVSSVSPSMSWDERIADMACKIN
jgi:hypothetical protein